MRYRVKLWCYGVIAMALGHKPRLLETKYFRWRWVAFLYELPYKFGPGIGGFMTWTKVDTVTVVRVDGRNVYAELDKHSTEIAR